MAWDDHQLVFVAGLHRSGTTLVADLLSSSPDVSGLENTGVPMDEGQHLQDVYGVAQGMLGNWSFDPREHLVERDVAIRPDVTARLWAQWSPYWDLSRGTLVEKSPPNLTKLLFLQAAFPGAKFVVVTRHPVVQAMAVRKWSQWYLGQYTVGFPKLVDHWFHAHDLFLTDAPHVEHLLVLRYEHLVARPQEEAERLAAFLGITLPDVAPVQTSRSSDYVETWEHPRRRGLPGRIRKHWGARNWKLRRSGITRELLDPLLLPGYRRTVRSLYSNLAPVHGYDLDRLSEAEPWPDQNRTDAPTGSTRA